MIKILIVDDEPLAHKVLENYCKPLDYIQIIGHCYDGISAINFLNENTVDAILLDIQMPDLTGIEILETLKLASPKVILTTAYTDYAFESFNYEQVVDYLHKPIRLVRFLKSIDRLKKQLILEHTIKNDGVKISTETHNSDSDYLVAKDNKILHRIPLNEITHLQSFGNYIKIYNEKGGFKMTRNTFKELENSLPDQQFIRVHKSYIINLKKITAKEGNQLIIKKIKIPIGKSYIIAIKKHLF